MPVYDILQLMYQDGYLSSSELAALKKTCFDLRENPVRLLRSLNIASQPEIQGFLQRFYRCDAATDELIGELETTMADWIPMDIALHCSVVGIGMEDKKLLVLMEDPSDKATRHKLEFFLGHEIKPIVATSMQLLQALCKVYEVSTEEVQLTTTVEASRGVVGGLEYDPSQSMPAKPHPSLLVDLGDRQKTLQALLDEGVYEKLRSVELSPPFTMPKKAQKSKKPKADASLNNLVANDNASQTDAPLLPLSPNEESETSITELAKKLAAPKAFQPQQVTTYANKALLRLSMQSHSLSRPSQTQDGKPVLLAAIAELNAIFGELGLSFQLAHTSGTKLTCYRDGEQLFLVDLMADQDSGNLENNQFSTIPLELRGLQPVFRLVAKMFRT